MVGCPAGNQIVPVQSSCAGQRKFTPVSSTSMNVLAVLVVSLVVADWSTRTVDAYHHGMTTVAPLWYHLPHRRVSFKRAQSLRTIILTWNW